MSLTELISFDKEGHLENHGLLRRLFLSLVIILLVLLSFGIGRLTAVGQGSGIKIEYDQSLSGGRNQAANALSARPTSSKVITTTEVVGSSKGNKYHYSHCPGAKQISEQNKIIFSSAETAEASGYILASNCKPQ